MSKPTLDQVTKAYEFAYVRGIPSCDAAHDWIDTLFSDGDICHLDQPRVAKYYRSGKPAYAVVLNEYRDGFI